MKPAQFRIVLLFNSIIVLTMLNACTSITTFPTAARAGDTLSVMVGSSEKARKETIQVVLTDNNGIQWDLQALGKIRSVFNLRADAISSGTHYSSYTESYFSWSKEHEPLQTVLVIDIPGNVATGAATLSVDTGVDDDSSGFSSPYTISMEIIPGTGQKNNFPRKDLANGYALVDFTRLERAPYAKIGFDNNQGIVIGAVSLVVDYDESVVNPDDINVYVPEATVRGSVNSTGAFGDKQRMVYWHNDGQQVFIDIAAPQGIDPTYLKVYLVHPRDVVGSPSLNITSYSVYDINGGDIVLAPVLEYFN